MKQTTARAKLAVFAALALALGGCQGADTQTKVATNKRDQMDSMAAKMETDPNASPEARKIAAGVLQQTEDQKQLDSFSNGN